MNAAKDIVDLLEKARRSVGGAETLLEKQFHDFSASRSYYAMFYVAQALLLTKGLCFSKHGAVISSFGKEFVKSGLFDPRFHRHLRDAFRLRQAGDYSTAAVVTKIQAKRLITQAKEFIGVATEFLVTQGHIGKREV